MSAMDLIPGYYWVKNCNEWTIAKYDEDGLWWFIGNDGSEKLNDTDIIGERIERRQSYPTSENSLHKHDVSFSLPNEGEIQKLYKDEMKKWKGTSWHTELEYHGDLFIDGAKAVVAYLKGNES